MIDLEQRRHGLGGSDAAAVLGVSPWRTPLDVYLEKRGEADPVESTEAMEWGTRLENSVAEAAAESLGVKVRRRNQMLTHPRHSWMIANLDREVVGKRALMEIKTAGYRSDEWGEAGTDQIPRHYVAQVVHYLAVRDYELAYVPVLFMRERRLAVYEIHRDPELETMLIEAEGRFWREHVEAGLPPEPTTLTDVRKRWPRDDGGIAVATDGVLESVGQLRAVREREREVESERERLEKMIKSHMGAAAELTDPQGQTLATWKSQTSRRLDTKALAQAHPELADEFRVEAKSRVFQLKKGA